MDDVDPSPAGKKMLAGEAPVFVTTEYPLGSALRSGAPALGGSRMSWPRMMMTRWPDGAVHVSCTCPSVVGEALTGAGVPARSSSLSSSM